MRSPRGFREVKTFAAAMLRTLNLPRHRSKGTWYGIPLHVHRKDREVERRESVVEIDRFYHAATDEERIDALRRVEAESVDEALFSLFVHSEARRLRRELQG